MLPGALKGVVIHSPRDKKMDDSIRIKLIQVAKAIEEFRSLELTEQLWLMPLLNKGIQSTLEILDLISEEPLSYEEIATELDINEQTVRQKLNALSIGGYLIDLTETTAFATTGRPRTLVRKQSNDMPQL